VPAPAEPVTPTPAAPAAHSNTTTCFFAQELKKDDFKRFELLPNFTEYKPPKYTLPPKTQDDPDFDLADNLRRFEDALDNDCCARRLDSSGVKRGPASEAARVSMCAWHQAALGDSAVACCAPAPPPAPPAAPAAPAAAAAGLHQLLPPPPQLTVTLLLLCTPHKQPLTPPTPLLPACCMQKKMKKAQNKPKTKVSCSTCARGRDCGRDSAHCMASTCRQAGAGAQPGVRGCAVPLVRVCHMWQQQQQAQL
jgi:hypothetical protein